MNVIARNLGESDDDFRRRAFASSREMQRALMLATGDELDTMCNQILKPSVKPMWGQGSCKPDGAPGTQATPCTIQQRREDSPSGKLAADAAFSWVWHVRAVVATVVTVMLGVWFLS